jgi:phosphatidylserine decarboxylase
MLVKPHPAGYPFIGIGAALSLLGLIIWNPAGIFFLCLTLFITYFFRDPVRAVPQKENLVIAPADGRVISIEQNTSLPDDLADTDDEAHYTKISIFLSVLDVHVNRIPVSGEIVQTFYYEGKFLNAELDKSSTENERASAVVQLEDGRYVGFSQIAGFVARRIITNLEKHQKVEAGERFGIIRFGSRMDVYLPKDVPSTVTVGQTTIGGETILADLKSKSENMVAKAI